VSATPPLGDANARDTNARATNTRDANAERDVIDRRAELVVPAEPLVSAELVVPAAPAARPLSRRERRELLAAQATQLAPAAEAEAIVPAEPVLEAGSAAGPELTAEIEAEVVIEAEAEVVLEADVVLEAEPEPEAEPAASTSPRRGAETGALHFTGPLHLAGASALPVGMPQRPASPRPAPGDGGSTRPGGANPAQPKSARRKRSMAASAFSAGVMSIVALMAVSVTAPAEAVAAASDSIAVTTIAPAPAQEVIKPEEIQAFVAPAEGQTVELDRDQNYALTTFEQIAIESGITMSSLFVNDANSAVQWPFAVGVGMSYGYGMRSGRMHQGIDFTPGSGAQIQSVADGTVRMGPAGGAYGVHLYVDHVVDGQRISSHYAHMQVGSVQVSDGQQVKVGDPIGKVGNTGRSFGAHLHFEMLVNGTEAIDPLPWLQKYAGGWQG